ncbi:BON domain-containing protein [Cupriavidus sp. WKF15]|uniref:BON domain-containing protein n=1 Tax=Cupriavidus sp. WKF15 TaxID=3032282 RepID=UPI0023E1FA0A|nr:BON domain-containing protein [Cupriavidus sp. WKF15]WER44699.1 BON domain-containing protein [Cupriavidus sp. WKF15]
MKGDIQLKQDVIEELTWDPSVNANEIGVQVADGVVTLTGHLRNFAEKYAAEAAVKRIPGVKALAVELDVRLPDDCRRTDSDIARAASNVLSWQAMVPGDRIKILVEHGVITLTGDVDWNYQRTAAERAVAGLFGVTGVTNAIAVRPMVDQRDLGQRIRDAIQRQAVVDASHVTVAVSEGDVKLGGSLRTWAEREAAYNAAWSAPGVISVDNNIRVDL